ncbi:MAG: hypothetical protein K6G47_03100 [Clostridia bacterium]|nr:hypothetical protein [Clostridia bacterium]
MIGKRYKFACLFLCTALTATSLMAAGCDKNSEEKTGTSGNESIEVDITSVSETAETSEEQETEEVEKTADPDEILARATELGLTEEDLRGKYDLFLKFDDVVTKNPELGDFRGFVYVLFPLIADHLEAENEEYFFDKLQRLTIKEETGSTQYVPETNTLIVGKSVVMIGNEKTRALNIVHTLMHFVDYSIDGDTSIACLMEDGSIRDMSEVAESEKGQIVKELNNPIFFEGGAVLNECKYYSYATSAFAKYSETVFMTGFEYIFGSEKLDEVFFDHNTSYKLTQVLSENGFTNEEIVRFFNGSEAFVSMSDPEYAAEDMMSPQEALIRLYENNRDTDYKEDKIFMDIISLVYYDKLASCPADHDPISELYYADQIVGWEKELAKKFNVDEDSAILNSYPMPIFIDGEIKATSLLRIFNSEEEQKAWVMDYSFDSNDSVNYEVIDVNWIPENPVVKLNVEVGSDAIELIDFYTVDNSAAHDQTVTGTNGALTDLYDSACEIGSKYGVHIWFDDLVPAGVLPEGASTADHDKIENALEKIGKVLELYPENYFDQLLFEYYSGFAICIYDGENIDSCRTSFVDGSYFMTVFVNVNASEVVGYSGAEDLRAEDFSSVDPITAQLVCDIWNCTEKFVSNHNAHFNTQSFNDDSWNDCNPKSYMYPNNEDDSFMSVVDTEENQPYFVRREAMVSAENDRLLTYEYVMLATLSGNDTSSLSDECKAKLFELSRGIRAVFDSTEWPDDLGWENIYS